MPNERPLILISNDDGFDSKGIQTLIDIAADYGDVVAVAPTYPQSGKASAITVDAPLRLTLVADKVSVKIFHVNGTPADCVKLAFFRALPRIPDLVLAGINHGYNSGNSAIYSGTMGAVFEGSFRKVPSIGFSFNDHGLEPDFSPCFPLIRQTIERVLGQGLPKGICLNVNFPNCGQIKGLKTVAGSTGYWEQEFEERFDPRGRAYYWLTGKYHDSDPDDDTTDNYWLARGYATVTPCRADQTAYDILSHK